MAELFVNIVTKFMKLAYERKVAPATALCFSLAFAAATHAQWARASLLLFMTAVTHFVGIQSKWEDE